jgi:hypothetical protein
MTPRDTPDIETSLSSESMLHAGFVTAGGSQGNGSPPTRRRDADSKKPSMATHSLFGESQAGSSRRLHPSNNKVIAELLIALRTSIAEPMCDASILTKSHSPRLHGEDELTQADYRACKKVSTRPQNPVFRPLAREVNKHFLAYYAGSSTQRSM